jgi:hypothetical protein
MFSFKLESAEWSSLMDDAVVFLPYFSLVRFVEFENLIVPVVAHELSLLFQILCIALTELRADNGPLIDGVEALAALSLETGVSQVEGSAEALKVEEVAEFSAKNPEVVAEKEPPQDVD